MIKMQMEIVKKKNSRFYSKKLNSFTSSSLKTWVQFESGTSLDIMQPVTGGCE